MNRKIFVNLPVRDLKRSKAFFGALGFAFNPQFTDENAACMIISDDIYAMLLKREFFATFTPRAVCEATAATEVLVCLSCESRAEVADLAGRALAAGATRHAEPKDHGFMLQDGFADPDGHIWELVYMEPSALEGPSAAS